ncbi:putative integrase catalytic domain-containing protein [Phytophthora infestans]|uniref:Putative integrase catalytic domain-containing protein n=1 Tax=Phytophthora infestans TaxID=4787 RepID=A0A833WHS8_PHYIN|nr:putative integrase catalytic domain-containing protein [Phytophthora infestans]
MTVVWFAKKQPTVALSTAEAEYIAGSIAVKECLRAQTDPVCPELDSQSVIKTMENEITTDRIKHVNIKFHFIRDTIERGEPNMK